MDEPKRRNAVVLLKDGSVARRNTDLDYPLAWTRYPVRPAPTVQHVVDPGFVQPWWALDQMGIERVLYSGLAEDDERVRVIARIEDGPEGERYLPRSTLRTFFDHEHYSIPEEADDGGPAHD